MKEHPWSKLRNWLISSSNIKRDAVIWNAISACLNSFQTMLLLLVLTHFGTDSDSGIFVMAYAAGNLMVYIGKFGMRQFQVTDVAEKYSYREYVNSRYFSCILMIIGSVLFILWGILGKDYTTEKAIVVGLIIVMKGFEAAEDVMHGRMQQKERLDIAAKILAIRFAIFIIGYAICFMVTRQLLLSTVVNVIITSILCIIMNNAVMPAFIEEKDKKAEKKIPWSLIWECLPLGLTLVTYMYLNNSPKYIVDGILSNDEQTRFNIVIMPAFVVALLSNFVFNPVLKKMGNLWADHQIMKLKKLVRKLALVPIGVGAVVVLAGYYLGPIVFSFVYGVDVKAYSGELLIFLLSSCVLALLNLFIALLTTMRKQQHLLYCYSVGSLIMLLAGRPILMHANLLCLCWFYLAILIAVVIYCALIYYITVHKQIIASTNQQ